jgi:signal transduction histidine kinase
MMARQTRRAGGEFTGLERIRQAERLHLSRRLHDQAGPQLCSAALVAEALRSTLEAPTPQQQALLAKIESVLGEAIEEIRTLSYAVAPDLAVRCGLEGALRLLARACGAGLEWKGAPQPLPPERAEALCSLVRDALFALGYGAEAPRIQVSPAQIRIRAASSVNEDIRLALEQSAREAQLGFRWKSHAGRTAIEILPGVES